MAEEPPETPFPPAPPHRGAIAIAFIGAGISLMAAGQTILHSPPMAYGGLAILAVGIVFGVQSQRGK